MGLQCSILGQKDLAAAEVLIINQRFPNTCENHKFGARKQKRMEHRLVPSPN